MGSGGTDLGSVLNGHCSECKVTSIICRCSHSSYYTAPVRTLYKGLPCGKRAFASYTMEMLNTLYDTPTCSPVGDSSTDSQSIRSCTLGLIPFRTRLHTFDRDFSCFRKWRGKPESPINVKSSFSYIAVRLQRSWQRT